MDSIASAPIWMMAVLIFVTRVVDVSLGTLRTVSIVKGYVLFEMVFGFFEVGIWITVVAQLISRMGDSWLLIVAYEGGGEEKVGGVVLEGSEVSLSCGAKFSATGSTNSSW